MIFDVLLSRLRGPSSAAIAVVPIAKASAPNARTHGIPRPTSDVPSAELLALQWQYQLKVSKPLQAIDLSRTLADQCSYKWRGRIIAFMSSYYKYIAMIHRVASLLYFMVLVLPPSGLRHAITSLVLFSIFTLTCTSLFLSLDVLRMLLRSSDVLFVSLINFVNWTCLGIMLGDMRAVVCFPSLYATQVGIFMDANFRTYPTVLRSIVASIPAVLSVALCCALDVVHDPQVRVVRIANRTISLANIITYTSMTISIFMAKKAFHKYKGSHASVAGFHTIPCVMLRSKMKLVAFKCQGRERREHTVTHDSVAQLQSSPHLQRLYLSRRSTSKIDGTVCLLTSCARDEHTLSKPLGQCVLVPLYITGLVGFTALATQNLDYLTSADYDPLTNSVSLAATVLFCSTFAVHLQRDLVLKLLTNFDFIFAAIQVIVGTFCIADLNARTGSAYTKSIVWMVWFLWLLLLDALPPIMRQRLRFRQHLAAPVELVLLVNTTWILVEIFLNNDVGKNNRVLFEYKLSAKQNYRLTTVSILVERLVTILGWCGTRITSHMLFADSDELLFLRGMVAYVSPFETFPPKATPAATTGDQCDPQEHTQDS